MAGEPDYSFIAGHKSQRAYLRALIERRRLPSTMLLVGPGGVGKSLVAREIAGSLLCEQQHFGGCDECRGCRLLRAGSHPDFHPLSAADGDEANVAGLRALIATLQLKPFYGGARVVVIRDADHLSMQGSNLLLKSLEEPAPQTYFLLTAINPTRLPPTVISRCQTWFFESLSNEEIASIICRHGIEIPSPLTLEQAVVLTDGSLENLTRLSAYLEIWEPLCGVLRDLFVGNVLAIVKLTQLLAGDKERTADALALVRVFAREQMLRTAAETSDSARWAILLHNALVAERLIFDRNLNVLYVSSALGHGLLPDTPPELPTMIGLHRTIDRVVV